MVKCCWTRWLFWRTLQFQKSWKSTWTLALLKCVSSWLSTPGNRPFLYFLHTLLRTSTLMDLTKITRKEWKHIMSQLRAGEGVRWTFCFNIAASTHIQSWGTPVVMVVDGLRAESYSPKATEQLSGWKWCLGTTDLQGIGASHVEAEDSLLVANPHNCLVIWSSFGVCLLFFIPHISQKQCG